LYVALTRAEEQLYIISGMQGRNKDGNLPKNMASFFIQFLEMKGEFREEQFAYEFGTAQKTRKPMLSWRRPRPFLNYGNY